MTSNYCKRCPSGVRQIDTIVTREISRSREQPSRGEQRWRSRSREQPSRGYQQHRRRSRSRSPPRSTPISSRSRIIDCISKCVTRTSSETPSNELIPRICSGGYNGISRGSVTFPRENLLNKIKILLSKYQIVLLNSPAATGKTTAVQMFIASNLKEDTDYKYVSMFSGSSAFERFSTGTGLQFNSAESRWVCASATDQARSMIIFLDDVQYKYPNLPPVSEMDILDQQFWEVLLKCPNSLPSNVKVALICTHLLSPTRSSPVEMHSFQGKLMYSDFVLTVEESFQLINHVELGFPDLIRDFNLLKTIIVNDCGGLIGALKMSIDAMIVKLGRSYEADELMAIDYYLNLVKFNASLFPRCFGGGGFNFTMSKETERYIILALKDYPLLPRLEVTDPTIRLLVQSGILVRRGVENSISFSSPLAKKCLMRVLYTDRQTSTKPTLVEFIKDCIKSMSAHLLQQADKLGEGIFPKDAIFQHLFMNSMTMNCDPRVSIIPELSNIIPATNEPLPPGKNRGEVDFFLIRNVPESLSFRWGVELLVEGREHLSRFEGQGKYVPLMCTDHIVVDFRQTVDGEPTNVILHPKRLTVFFKTHGDFKTCVCVGPSHASEELSLRGDGGRH